MLKLAGDSIARPRTPSMAMPVAIAFSLLLSLELGCTSPAISSQQVPGTHLADHQTFHIPSHDGDQDIHTMLETELVRRGKTVSTSESEVIPDGTDVLVRYTDKWFWDMGTYLLDLKVDFRDPATNVLLATGNSNRPSIVRATPGEMVREVIKAIFEGPPLKGGK